MTDIQDQNRSRILDATEVLLREAGRDALTVRAVAEAAQVQLPTLYRLFTDKVGLLEAMIERGFLRYMAIDPIPEGTTDVLAVFRRGWDIHVGFGRDNPELYSLMYGDFTMRKDSPAVRAAMGGLADLIEKLALSGVLRVSREEATFRVMASASGAVLALQFLPPGSNREVYLTNLREALVRDVTTEGLPVGIDPVREAVSTLEGNLPSFEVLSPGERRLLQEWLDRIRRRDGPD